MLWLYNLHYFDYLWELDYPECRRGAGDWIERHDLRRGRVGWQPYPVAMRLQNWCTTFFARHRRETEADPEFRERLWGSIWLQAGWLAEHLETHLLANHLLEDGVALALVGACFAGDDARRFKDVGLRVLTAEIPEQILEDGLHFELSPMYHLRATQALATLAASGDAELIRLVEQPLARMIEALERLCHPDGQIALLNDSAFAIYNTPSTVAAFARQALAGRAPARSDTSGPFELAASGYFGSRTAGEAGEHYIVCDAGAIGPDYQPGHAHGDIFSFELSLDGRRVVVDCGNYDYENTAMRSHCRSTRAHNTLELDGQDQSEFWQAHRVGRRAVPRDVRHIAGPAGFRLSGRHDGYRTRPGSPHHAREFVWDDAGVLLVRDRILGGRSPAAVSRLHLHPDCRIDASTERSVTVRHPGGSFEVHFRGAGRLDVEDSWYCPEFGRKLPNRALTFSFTGDDAPRGFCISRPPLSAFELDSGAVVAGRSIGWQVD